MPRKPTEEEEAEYREEAARLRYEREQARNRARHPHDPDYIAPKENETEVDTNVR